MTALKFAEEGLVEGLGVPFGGPNHRDRHGEYFSAATDLGLAWFESRPLLLHHGLADAGPEVVGRVTAVEVRPEGLWVKAQLDRAGRWFAKIRDMLEAGALSFSSGSVAHLVKVGPDGAILTWPLVEMSLTPTPASDDARVYRVKARTALEHYVDAGLSTAALKALIAADDRDELRLIRSHLAGITPVRGLAHAGNDGAVIIQPESVTRHG